METTKFTKGPWMWQVNEKSKEVRLVALHSGSLIVMDFDRWGMQGAQPRFNAGWMKEVSELSTVVEGREHHADWYKTISHPDAALIAAAPSMYEGIKALNLALDNYWNATVKTDKLMKDVLKQQKNCWEIITQATS